MIFEVDSKDLSRVLNKVCGIASTDSRDGQACEIKITARDGKVGLQSINSTSTMWSMAILSDGVEILAEGSICVPADAIQQTANLTKGKRLRLSKEKGGLSISQSGEDNAKHNRVLLAGMNPDDWTGMTKISEEATEFTMTKGSFASLARCTGFCTSQNRTKAPLTAVLVEVGKTGLQATAYDMNKVAFYNDSETKCDGDLAFMLHPESAKRVLGFFDDDTLIKISVDRKKLLFSSEGLHFGCVPEVGVETYPALRVHLVPQKTFTCTFKASDLQRAAGLLHAAAPRSVCEISVERDGTVTLQAEESSNKAIQRLKADITDGDYFNADGKLLMFVGCYDLVEGLKAVNGDIVELCSAQSKNEQIGNMFELRIGKQWRHIIFRSTYGSQQEDD